MPLRPLVVAASLLMLASLPSHAETPAHIAMAYANQAGNGFTASAERGRALFTTARSVNPELSACTACHTANPASPGRHAITGKLLAPMSPQTNPERLTDPAKAEKWFRRNCKEVIGRECSSGEKADVMAWLMKGG